MAELEGRTAALCFSSPYRHCNVTLNPQETAEYKIVLPICLYHDNCFQLRKKQELIFKLQKQNHQILLICSSLSNQSNSTRFVHELSRKITFSGNFYSKQNFYQQLQSDPLKYSCGSQLKFWTFDNNQYCMFIKAASCVNNSPELDELDDL